MQESNAILAISSTDRYITSKLGRVNQPVSNLLEGEYNARGPYANDFSIEAPGALINGYIKKMVISQIQLQYNVPTLIPDQNDLLPILYEITEDSGIYLLKYFEIPYGFYTPDALAAVTQSIMNEKLPGRGGWTVSYFGQTGLDQGFAISTQAGIQRFFLPTPAQARSPPPGSVPLTEAQIINMLKTYKTFGFTVDDSNPSIYQISWSSPQFLYTPYIDIYSDALTNYQKLKDTDTSISRRKGLLARVYLSGTGNPQATSALYKDASGNVITQSESLGARPFLATYDLNSPKVIGWTPDTAVNSLDFQMRDCYGDLLFTKVNPVFPGNPVEQWNTEFQMTLLCVEQKY